MCLHTEKKDQLIQLLRFVKYAAATLLIGSNIFFFIFLSVLLSQELEWEHQPEKYSIKNISYIHCAGPKNAFS